MALHLKLSKIEELEERFESSIKELPQWKEVLSIVYQDGLEYNHREKKDNTHSYLFGLYCTKRFTPFFIIGRYDAGYALTMKLSENRYTHISDEQRRYCSVYEVSTDLLNKLPSAAIAYMIMTGSTDLMRFNLSKKLYNTIYKLHF